MVNIVAISDTHSLHHGLTVPAADILLHAGDFSNRGSIMETTSFLDWYASQPATYKLFICGNHDRSGFENPTWLRQEAADRGIIYLQNELACVMGVTIYGSPWTPEFGNWSFMYPRNSPMAEANWAEVPADIDVLLTHGPAYGTLDVCPSLGRSTEATVSVGCEVLANALARIKPKFHVFGHIHEQGGQQRTDNATTSINAALANPRVFRLAQNPQQFAIIDEHAQELFI